MLEAERSLEVKGSAVLDSIEVCFFVTPSTQVQVFFAIFTPFSRYLLREVDPELKFLRWHCSIQRVKSPMHSRRFDDTTISGSMGINLHRVTPYRVKEVSMERSPLHEGEQKEGM